MQGNEAIYNPLKRWNLRALWLLGALLAAGCGGQKQSGPPPAAPEVGTVVVGSERVVLTKELPGRTVPYLAAEIRPQASGIVQQRLFAEGTDVEAGEVLYELDPSSYQVACAHAEASVAAARAGHTTALAAQSRARASQANAEAAVVAAKAGHATALATRDAARAALVAAKADRARAEANAVPLRLRAERFGELVASKAISQQDFDDVVAALRQAEAGIDSAAAGVQAAEADLGRAEAGIQVAEAEVQRAMAGIQAAEAEIESAAAAAEAALAAIASAEAGLEAARINLAYTRITAPITGRIGRSAVTTGALVTAHQPVALAVIQQLDPIYVDVPQATAELLRWQRRLADGRLSRDATTRNAVRLLFEDGTAYPLEGILQFRDVSVDPSTGSFILRMVFPNPDKTLLPGMFVRAVVQEGVNERALLIPQQAVSRDAKGDPLAMIVDAHSKAAVRMLTLDRAIGDRWLVTSGLAVNDRVIVEGLQRVRPGTPVRAVPLVAGNEQSIAPANAAEPAPNAN